MHRVISNRITRALLVALALLLPSATYAQVLNPQRVEFDPSPDHNATLPDGTALVTGYQMELYRSGEAAAFQTLSLGKPGVDADGKVRVDFVSLISPPLPAGVVYEARVSAVGPGGVADSAPSNTFSFATSCTFAISPTGFNAPASGASGTVTVTAATGCAWSTVGTASWITVTSGASGSGAGSVVFTVAPNTATSARTGSLTVGGQTFTVTQAGLACTYALTPASQSVPAAGGTTSFTVTAPAGCAWTATPTAAWITVAAGPSGSGNGTVTIMVAANSATNTRSGGVNVGGQVFVVSQAATTCGFSVSPTSQTLPASGGSASISVATSAACSWTSSSATPWISIVSGASGNGAGTVSISASANSGSTARSATITIAGQSVSVSQPAATTQNCTFTLSPTSKSVNAKASTGTISVSTGTGCNWSAVSSASWLTAKGSGTTSGSVTYSVAANTTNAQRSGTITVGSGLMTIVQRADGNPSPPGHVRVVTSGGQ
jgi:BACON domain-containing protein/all-beta uncharacterized protein